MNFHNTGAIAHPSVPHIIHHIGMALRNSTPMAPRAAKTAPCAVLSRQELQRLVAAMID
ncbi:hypothetical protein GRI97_05335 [Altererythrobacter xixiisoli]|uniref:Uncharacterized protein n=1 Tax=Croceibacterium xixiisoli TaxID=1476466 RepID=A0A6I4TU79_9SPHN|nr:hypothetical protein [Croceibacterium xixiisoli]MXO98407.1 hypothetical protein [Croceibacterium xixiisoli]